METQNVSGSADTFADKINQVLRIGLRSPEENKRFKEELEERQFEAMRRRIEAKESQRSEWKIGARKVIQQNRDLQEWPK